MKTGWQTKRLGDVCGIIKGRKPILKKNPSDGDMPYLIAKVIRGSKEAEYASVKDRNSVLVEKSETIIICDGSNSGEVFTGFQGILSSTMGKISKKAEVDDNYLRAFLSSTFEVFKEAKTGAAIPHLDKEAVYQLKFPLPPLPEQQRIVGILDEALEGIAIAKSNAEKNVQNAKDLFESYLNDIFTHLDAEWIESRLQTITTKIGSGATPTGGGDAYKSDGISLIRSLNVHDMGFRYEKLAFIDELQASKLSNVEVQPHDVLLNITGASVARCCIVPEAVLPARVNQHVSIIRPIGDILNTKFLHYLLISKPYKDKLLQTGEEGGSTRQAITKAQIQEFKICYPKTLNEQQGIVANLDAFSTQTHQLEAIYKRKIAALEELKKSLLHQAFTGNL